MLRYNRNEKMGEMTVTQHQQDGETVTFVVKIYRGNCLAVFINEYYRDDGQRMEGLYWFFADRKHATNIIKSSGALLPEEPDEIRLNLVYKESETLLRLLVKNGYKVNCYYENAENN